LYTENSVAVTQAGAVDIPSTVPGADTKLAAVRAFHEALLPSTLANALKAEFYRSLWQGAHGCLPDLDNLAQLPVVYKEQIRAASRRAQVRDDVVCNEVFTSGTSGYPLVTVRGTAEQEFLREFFAQISPRQGPDRLLRGLQINNPYHGYHVAVPGPVHFHQIGIYDAGSFEHGRRVLVEGSEDAGVENSCSVLLGLERCLRAFTQDTWTRYPDGIDTRLVAVISYSQYLTRRWRELFGRVWRCPVIDRFSLAEVFGGAGQCLKCGWWHFDPFLIPEVVTPRTLAPVKEGMGILLLTALFPFQQAQPMVRYCTGDLVEVTHSRGCRPGLLSMRPQGRAAFGVPSLRDGEWLLTPAQILEVVDAMPQVARLPRFQDSAQVLDPFTIGHPKYHTSYRVEGEQTRIIVEVETRDPLGDAPPLENRIRESLLSESEPLAEAVRAGKAVLEVQAAAGLKPDLISHSM
jgi:phenylacetate-coenzyme A ligase PaaK-like adenylate-forming protein